MKNVMMMLVSVVLGVLTLAVVLTVCGSMSRRTETYANLSSAMEKTAELMSDSLGMQQSEAVAECIENVVAAMDSDSNLEVDVHQADVKKGVLAIKILEKFRHPNGERAVAQWERTVIFNQVKMEETGIYEVRFFKSKEDMLSGEKCYKTYRVQEGDYVLTPAVPVLQEAVFLSWRDSNDYLADFSQPVQQDLVYYAEWN